MIEIYRSENVVARAVPSAETSRWIVTFDNYSIGHGFDRDGFSQRFLNEQGISAVHIMGKREDWYQYSEMESALRSVRDYLADANRVITYGSSMGAYAALRFADQLGADGVLALSPQYSIDPRKAPFETRWSQDALRLDWLAGLEPPLPTVARAVVVYDPATIDRLHADLIAAEADITAIPVRYSGHPSGAMLAETHLLTPLLLDVLNGEADLSSHRRLARAVRGESSSYLINLARRLPLRRSEIAISLAQRAIDLRPLHVDALRFMADRLMAAGRVEEAMQHYMRAVDASDNGIAALIPYAEALGAQGRYDEAMAIARDVSMRPESAHMAHIQAWHGLVAYQAGYKKEALIAAQKAVDLHPGEPAYRAMLDRHLKEANSPTNIKSLRDRLWLRLFRRRPATFSR